MFLINQWVKCTSDPWTTRALSCLGDSGWSQAPPIPLASVNSERANVSMIKDKEQLPRRPPLVNIYKLLCSAHWFIWNKSRMT